MPAFAFRPVGDITADDGLLMEQAHLDGNAAQHFADGLVIAAPAVNGDAPEAEACFHEFMQPLAQLPDAFSLYLTEPDDAMRIMEAEIAVTAPEEGCIHQQVDGMGRSGNLYTFRRVEPVKRLRQRRIGDFQITAQARQCPATKKPIAIVPAPVRPAMAFMLPAIQALVAFVRLNAPLQAVLFDCAKAALRAVFDSYRFKSMRKCMNLLPKNQKSAPHFFNYA